MLLSTYIGLIVRPIHTIQQIVNDRPVGLGLLTLFVVVLVGALINLGVGFDPTEASSEDVTFPEFSIGLIASMSFVIALYVLPMAAILALIPHFIAKMLGGDGSYTGYLSGATMTSFVSLVGTVIVAVFSVLLSSDDAAAARDSISSVIVIAVSIWVLVLTAIVIRENYRVTTGVAVLTTILSLALSFIAAIFLGIILGLLLLLVLIIFGLTFV